MTGTVIAAVWGLVTNRQVPVLVAVSDLPAYHEVTLNDLTMDTRAVLGENDYVTLPVDGRITLKNLKKGQPLLNTDLSPKIQGMVRGDLRVVGLDVSRGDVLGGALQSGDPVLVLLIERGHPPRELRAVVLSASSAGATTTNWSLVLVMNGREARNHAATLARNDVLILRNPKATVFR
ncbi:SAF domain-containing protein [Streptosporangium sp. NPDC049248]|uniref:SAF domain-containing protein n=1 Tax=Streptosporangium sp. NPDC049248 TaxID=3155651 RepID=UPI0034231B53